MNYKERLLHEYSDLVIRMDRLRKYIYKSNDSNSLEIKQLNAMEDYRICLANRIFNLMK